MYIIVINYNVDGGSNYETFSSSLTNLIQILCNNISNKKREKTKKNQEKNILLYYYEYFAVWIVHNV